MAAYPGAIIYYRNRDTDTYNHTVYSNTVLSLDDLNSQSSLDFTNGTNNFLYWNTSKDGTGTTYNVGDTTDSSTTTTLYAIWEAAPSIVAVTESHLQDIADAIREKNGSSDTYTPAEMASAISGIPSGGSYTDITAQFADAMSNYYDIEDGFAIIASNGLVHYYALIRVILNTDELINGNLVIPIPMPNNYTHAMNPTAYGVISEDGTTLLGVGELSLGTVSSINDGFAYLYAGIDPELVTYGIDYGGFVAGSVYFSNLT